MEVSVKEYDSAKAYRKDANKMAKRGWTVQSSDTRNKKWSLLGGFLTRKEIITVTYVK